MEKIYRIQKQITLNIIEVLKEKNVNENEYVEYLHQRTSLNKKRIKNLLDINVKKRMTLKEIEIIALGLSIDIAILFKGVLQSGTKN